MNKLNVKPLSVNQCWQGRRFKTKEYKNYEKEVLLLLPKIKELEPPFRIDIVFMFSNKLSDIDNPLKPILDIIQKKYGINDRDVYELNVKKEVVKKGMDGIMFNITNKN